jgi:hypothetical protein
MPDTGDLYYRDSNGDLAKLPIGANGDQLVVSSSLPAWGTPTAKPSFSVYSTAGQSISASTPTKIQFNAETFDTNNNFDITTNYRFTPTVAGKYLINCAVRFASGGVGSGNAVIASIYKNGTELHSVQLAEGANTNGVIPCVTAVIDFNGSSDYVEFYANHGGSGSKSLVTTSTNLWASGAKID